MASTAERTRCIVFIPGGTGLDVGVHQRLTDRGWQVETQPVLERAVAEMCLLARTQHARSGWGLPASERLVLVMPPALEEDAMVRDALAQFAPEVVVCGMRNGDLDEASQALLDDAPTPLARAASNPASIEPALTTPTPDPPLTPTRRTGAPQLRLTGVMENAAQEPIPPFSAEVEEASDEDAEGDASVVTRDELEMLLETDQPRKEPG